MMLSLALAGSVAHAGSVARAMEVATRAALPTCQVSVRRGELRGRCGGTRGFDVPIRPVEIACENGPTACDDARAAVVNRLAGLYGLPTAPPLSIVVPVVRDRSYLDGLLVLVAMVQERGDDVGHRAPVHTPFGANIEVLYLIDSETEARAVNLGELTALNLEPQTLHDATVGNTARFAGEVDIEIEGQFERWTGSYYLSSLVLDHTRWPGVAQGQPLLVAIPSNNTLLLLHSTAAEDVAALEMRAAYEHSIATRPVSRAVFYWTGSGWERWTGALPGKLGRRD